MVNIEPNIAPLCAKPCGDVSFLTINGITYWGCMDHHASLAYWASRRFFLPAKINIFLHQNKTGWWLNRPYEKYEFVSWDYYGMMTFPSYMEK